MKFALIAVIVLPVWALADEGDESEHGRLKWLKQWMRQENCWTDDMTLEEVGGRDGLVLIKQEGKFVGYYYEQYEWKPEDLAGLDLSKVTRITYGAPGPAGSEYTPIEITERTEIALWVAAYKNHTEQQRGHAYFVPLTPEAGFAFTREEIDYGGTHMCGLGVRFYASDELVLRLSGHLHESSMLDWRTSNEALHLLVKVRMPESEDGTREDEPYDPFSDSANWPESQAEQQ